MITVIFNTLNDNYEARMTLKSILDTAGQKVNIIIVDDCSDTPFEFNEPAPNLRIMRMRKRIGCGPTRHVGITAATTEFILIVDGHMRFQPGWVEAAESRIADRPKTIHSATCLGLDQHQQMDISNHRGAYNGAWLNILGPDPNKPSLTQVLEGVWMKDRPDEDDYEISCIMGASYFMRREWYFHIGGLKSLRMWGSDEPLLSLKTWLAGGECRIMKTVQIGHKFRQPEEQGFKISEWNTLWNKMFVLYTVMNTAESTFLIKRLPRSVEMKRATEQFESDRHFVEVERCYNEKIFTRDLRWYCDRFDLKYPLT